MFSLFLLAFIIWDFHLERKRLFLDPDRLSNQATISPAATNSNFSGMSLSFSNNLSSNFPTLNPILGVYVILSIVALIFVMNTVRNFLHATRMIVFNFFKFSSVR